MIREIIPTLTIYPDDIHKYEEFAKSYWELGVSTVRVNMTRFDNQRYIKDLDTLKKAFYKISGGKSLNYLLDLPVPSKKPRVFYMGGSSGFQVSKDDIFNIVSDKSKAYIENHCIYIDDENFCKSMRENNIKTLYTDDGRLIFECIYEKDKIVIRALTDGYVSYFQAIS